MKHSLICFMALAAALISGCNRGPIPTREIYFYRGADVNQGRPCAIDIIYPKDKAECDKVVKEVGPQKWFQSALYDVVPKDKGWLVPDAWLTVVKLNTKQKMDPFMAIFPEFTKPSERPPRGQEPFYLYLKEMKPKPRTREYIYVHDGSLERLSKPPKRPTR